MWRLRVGVAVAAERGLEIIDENEEDVRLRFYGLKNGRPDQPHEQGGEWSEGRSFHRVRLGSRRMVDNDRVLMVPL